MIMEEALKMATSQECIRKRGIKMSATKLAHEAKLFYPQEVMNKSQSVFRVEQRVRALIAKPRLSRNIEVRG